MIRKFYDVNAPEGGGMADIAAMMAKQGVKTEENITVDIPNINTGVQEGEPKPQEQKTETASTPVAAEAPAPEPHKQEPAPVTRPADAQQPTVVEPDWKEVLKKQPEVEVFKHLGLDEKMINFLNRWKGGEDLKTYLEAATTDYTKMAPEEIMRRYYLREFGAMSPEDFEELYRMKVVEQFKLDPDVFDEKEVHRGRLLLNYEAKKIREDFIKQQQDLLFSKPPEPAPPQHEIEAAAIQAEREKAVAEYKGLVEKDAFTQDLLNKKMMTIGEGEEAFNYEVATPQSYLDILYDPNQWASKLYNADGTPNVKKQLLLAAIANDDSAFFTNYAKHHQRIGAKRAIEPIENASTPNGTPANDGGLPLDPAAALARGGIITSG